MLGTDGSAKEQLFLDCDSSDEEPMPQDRNSVELTKYLAAQQWLNMKRLSRGSVGSD